MTWHQQHLARDRLRALSFTLARVIEMKKFEKITYYPYVRVCVCCWNAGKNKLQKRAQLQKGSARVRCGGWRAGSRGRTRSTASCELLHREVKSCLHPLGRSGAPHSRGRHAASGGVRVPPLLLAAVVLPPYCFFPGRAMRCSASRSMSPACGMHLASRPDAYGRGTSAPQMRTGGASR